MHSILTKCASLASLLVVIVSHPPCSPPTQTAKSYSREGALKPLTPQLASISLADPGVKLLALPFFLLQSLTVVSLCYWLHLALHAICQ